MKWLDKAKGFFKNSFPTTQTSNPSPLNFTVQKINVTVQSRTIGPVYWTDNQTPDETGDWYEDRYKLDFSDSPKWYKEVYGTVFDFFKDSQPSTYPTVLSRELPRMSGKTTFCQKMIEHFYDAVNNDVLEIHKIFYIGCNYNCTRDFQRKLPNGMISSGFLTTYANFDNALNNASDFPKGKTVLYILDDNKADPNTYAHQIMQSVHDKVLIMKLYTPH